MNLIQDHVFENVKNLRNEFSTATPYKHVAIDNFFTDEALGRLLDEFPSHGSTEGLVGDFGGKTKKAGRSDVIQLGPTYRLWDKCLQSHQFLNLLSEITDIDDLLYDPTYNGAGTHENFEGKRGNIHIDYNYHPKTGLHRRLNAIVYITPGWKETYGGGLKVYQHGRTPNTGEKKTLACVPNRCVLFETTEHSWHGIESIQLPDDMKSLTRKSLSTYFYTQDRPEGLTFPRHSTIYYPGELSTSMRVGKVVTEEDLHDITAYQKRANGLIANLYKEHSRLLERVTKLRAAAERRNESSQRFKPENLLAKLKFW